ncbi:MAG: carboxylesterase family protein [Cyclobacteriaceae bacterium]|nr:carboxylesterase family protein [Cyclobacteriaceae bacterium]
MKKIILIGVLCVTTLFSFSQKKPVVDTAHGKVSGVQLGEVAVFKGVPFAAPPVGALRWRAPQPVANWSGVRACDKFSASPMQGKPVPFNMWTEEFIAPPEPLSEDCLYLNIWTKGKSKKDKLPVFVWIYGGGFVSGSSACAIYDGEEMAKQGIVFVSINYRVGVFGFLAHPELTRESGKRASGNYGLMDQLEALRWIQKNITAFGGDPNNVTIAGQSAGSFSINALVASSLGKGLFHKAIAQSGGFLGSGTIGRQLPEAEESGVVFSAKVQATTLQQLRSLPDSIIQQAAAKMPWGSFAPVFEDYVLPTQILRHFREGKHNDVPLLTGWVTGDGMLRAGNALPPGQFIKQAEVKYKDASGQFLELFPATTKEESRASQVRLGLCEFAVLPSHLWAVYNKSDSYLYQVSFVPTDKPDFPNYGSFHTSEVPYALHTLHRWNRPWQERDRVQEQIMSTYWINFIRTGNPNGTGVPEWSTYTADTGLIQDFGDEIKQGPILQKEIAFLASRINRELRQRPAGK